MKLLKKPSPPSWAFPPVERPTYTDKLRFPENLPALSGRDLGLYHGQYVGLHAYASSELSKLQGKILRAESELNAIHTSRAIALSAQKYPKWEIEIMIEGSEKWKEKKEELLLLQIKKESTFSMCLNFERYAAALSREMSRRASESRIM